MNGMANVVPPPGTPRIRNLQTQATRLKKTHQVEDMDRYGVVMFCPRI